MQNDIISLYDINFKYENNQIYFLNKKKIATIKNGSYDNIKDRVLDNTDISDLMELDRKYYLIVEEPWEIIGVITLHKGYTFIDCAEYDERVIIHSAFPDKECNILM